jgi:hypothetical protein
MSRALRAARFVALALLVLAAVAPRAAAQSGDHEAVRATITGLFDAMRARDTSAMRATFDSSAVLRSIGPRGVRSDAVDAWISSIATAPAGLVLDERLGEQRIQLDGPLATVWVRYQFFAGDRFSHCGVNAFILAKRGEAWKILAVVDTRQREGCPTSP